MGDTDKNKDACIFSIKKINVVKTGSGAAWREEREGKWETSVILSKILKNIIKKTINYCETLWKRLCMYIIYLHIYSSSWFLKKLNKKYLNIIEYANLYILNNCIFKGNFHIDIFLLFFPSISSFLLFFLLCENFQSRKNKCCSLT